MNLNIKRTKISLSDEVSPLYRFINARKSLQDIYFNNKRLKTIQNLNNNLYNSTDKKDKKIKKNALKASSVKLLKDQIFIITHFSKRNKGNEINYDYNTSLLNTFGNRNFFKKNNIKMNINMFPNFSNNNNFFKTTAINYSKKKENPIKKQKISIDKVKLPKLNSIVKKHSKSIKL